MLLMKANWIRWIAAALMLMSLALLVSSPAMAEITPLPLDQTVPGAKPLDSGWLSDMEYQDESIHMTAKAVTLKPFGSKGEITCHIVHVKIADPTQIRTYMSNATYKGVAKEEGTTMARRVNAICAVNGDFFKYFYDVGYVVRQGIFYRNALNGIRDVLLIDDKGDFHIAPVATKESMEAFLANEFPADRQIINSFTFGPTLVRDGQAQDMEKYFSVARSEFDWPYNAQRASIVQVGELEYAIMECGGGNGSGMTMQQFADWIAETWPTARIAYNLDGGGSTHVIVKGERINMCLGHRPIGDILYFASAISGEE